MSVETKQIIFFLFGIVLSVACGVVAYWIEKKKVKQ
jgi:hypothetical protein